MTSIMAPSRQRSTLSCYEAFAGWRTPPKPRTDISAAKAVRMQGGGSASASMCLIKRADFSGETREMAVSLFLHAGASPSRIDPLYTGLVQ